MIVSAALIAGAILLGSASIVWVMLRVVSSFGAYEARRSKSDLLILAIHETQQAIVGQNDKLLAELRAAKVNGKKEVA